MLETLLQGNQLKRTDRTGWTQRGVPAAESVAAHSYGVVFTTMLLAELVTAEIDLGRALALAVLHDLPEARTSDIPRPAWRYLPVGSKEQAERQAMSEILDGLPFAADWLALWDELTANESAPARLVHDADRIDLYLQAWVYEQQSGNRRLAEFWARPATFHYPEAEALYRALRQRREASGR